MTTRKLHVNPVLAFLAALKARFAAARRRQAHANRQAHARRSLMRLDDATLRDLGLDRSEIASMVSEMSGDTEHTRLRLIARQGR